MLGPCLLRGMATVFKRFCFVVLTFWSFTINNAKPSIIFLSFACLNYETAFNNRTKDARLVWSKPFRLSQFLHRNRTAKMLNVVIVGSCIVVCKMIIRWCPPFDLSNNAIGTRSWFLIHFYCLCWCFIFVKCNCKNFVFIIFLFFFCRVLSPFDNVRVMKLFS